MNTKPGPSRIRVTVTGRPLRKSDAAKLDHLIVLLPHRAGKAVLEQSPYAERIAELRRRAPDKTGILHGALPDSRGIGLTIATLPKAPSMFARLDLCRKVISAATKSNPATIGAQLLEAADDRDETASALAVAALATGMQLPNFKAKAPKPQRFKRLRLFDAPDVDLERLRIEADNNDLARWLTALPANVLTAATLVDCARDIATQEGYEFTLYDEIELEKRGAGAFMAVARGNEHSDAGIVHLHRPGNGGASVALVGKGVCFDTGGINVKPANYMNGMQEDMQGSAVALASFRALAALDPTLELDCWLAATENRINGDAYTPNEIVTALNGKTIEVIHSDAEGRMALADTLILACERRPDLLIDYATLTGACVGALTTRYSGVFSNRDWLAQAAMASGATSGERVWAFPFDADFDSSISSDQADVKQCSLAPGGDHILAARFLSRFVAEKTNWLHVDLSAGNHKGGLGHIPTDVTGFGVRLTTQLVLDSDALSRARS